MICFQGKTININNPIVCRVVLPGSQLAHNDSDFLFSEQFTSDIDYPGIITKLNNISTDSPIKIFQYNSDDLFLNEGDILLIEPHGTATKIYDPNSLTHSIFVTDRCNCRCLMCPQPPKKQDSINWIDLSLKSIELMSPETKCLGITGGEPTLEWDGLINIIKACKSSLPSTYVQLLTNARILKDFAKAKELAESGGDNLFIGVPLYSDIDFIHDGLCGSKGAFWDCIEGLYNLGRAGIVIELRNVITKANFDRLPQFAEFIYRTMPFVGCVAFMAMEPIGKAGKNIQRLWIDPLDYLPQLEKAIKTLWRRNIRVSIFNHQLCTLPRALWPLAKKTISDWKIIYLDECSECIEKENCGGFFFSASNHKSRMISPILN